MKKRQALILILSAFILTLLAIYFGMAIYFNTHFFPGSTINHLDASNKTVEEVENAIRNETKDYVLQIKGRNQLSDVITADDIDYDYVSDNSISKLLKQQNVFLWFVHIFQSNENEMVIPTHFNEEKLKNKINSLIFLQKEHIKAPIDATVKFNNANEQFEVVPEDPGSLIQKKILSESIQKAIQSGDTYLSLEDEKCYKNAKYTSKSTELKELAKKMNQYTSVTITYQFGDRFEICDRNYIQDWLIISDDFKVSFDLEKVRSYIDSIARIYNTWGKTRDFIKHDGKMIEVSGGDYGWLMDRAAETERLVQLIKEGKNVQVEPTYSQTARSRNKNDIGDSYIEIDLTLQHIWVYKNGKLVVDADCVTGNSSRGHDTPTGIYQITYKERETTLDGANYSSEVDYWMPFWYNVGLHDAPWRNSFGGKIYKTNGSHGCVNLPPKVAATVYENIEKGTPVVVYKSKEKKQTASVDKNQITENKTNVTNSENDIKNSASSAE